MKAETPQNLRMFEVRYIGPTTFKGSRIKVTDLRHNLSVTMSYAPETNRIEDQAQEWLASKGIECSFAAWNEKTKIVYLLTDNFKTMIKNGRGL